MYIDLHCHTKKTKSSEPITRNVDKTKFIETLSNKSVSIVAITNHNHFDYSQYIDFANNDSVIVWPGVEFDVKGIESSAHCIVICNPNQLDDFNKVVERLIDNKHPDIVSIQMESFVNAFKILDVIFIVHYGRKQPSFEQHDFERLKELCKDSIPLFIEVQNLRSAGIMIAYNMRTLIGSDLKDWDEYNSYLLPELKFRIESFDSFKLALKKEYSIIQSFLSEKLKEVIQIKPFADLELTLNVYNDINVFIGGKGTGKTKILECIHDYYKSLGISDISYYFAQNKIDLYKDIVKEECKEEDFLVFGIEDDKNEYQKITKWKEAKVTPTSEYFKWGKSKDSKQYEKNFGYKNSIYNEIISDIDYTNANNDYKIISSNFDKINKVELSQFLDENELKIFIELVEKIKFKSKQKVLHEYCELQSKNLLKKSLELFKIAFQMCSGVVSLPLSPGLTNQYQNSLVITKSAQVIFNNLSMEKIDIRRNIGTLHGKGALYSVKTISINPEYLNANSKYNKLGMNITTIKELKKSINKLQIEALKPECGEFVKKFVDLCKEKYITSTKDIMGISSSIVKENNECYTPSNGEQSMLVLSNALIDNNKSIYILDEPENSVGHVYINTVIVPRLKELSRLGKKVFISTHDANIAIRTLPCQTIYREDIGNSKYKTYFGSPFIDNLEDIEDLNNKLNWSDISLDTLEGGLAAFIEREETYFGSTQ